MNDKSIQLGDYQWTINEIIEQVTDGNLEGLFYSWGEFSTPTKYVRCDGSNMAIRKCTVTSQVFIECDFSHIDASDTVFIDCLFLNCSFEHANLNNVTFAGTAIIQNGEMSKKEMFKNAGMFRTKFKSSSLNRTVLSQLNFKGRSFRYSIFENVIFNEMSTKHASFENAYLNGCTIDCLDLQNSSCRGIIINNCKIKKYASSLEKALGGIGILQTLEHCNDIKLSDMNGNVIDRIDMLCEKLEDVSQNFRSEGKFFEYINIMNYLYTRKQENEKKYILQPESALKLSIHNDSINGYPVSEGGMLLCQGVRLSCETITDNGNKISLDDVLYTLQLMFFFNINEYILLKTLLSIYKNEVLTRQDEYSDLLILSQIKHYFQAVGSRIKSEVYRITFHSATASWLSQDDRNDFYEFCKEFISVVADGNNDFKLVSMHEGSIDAIFESLFNIQNILIASAILGCRFEMRDGKINFTFNPAEGIKSYGEFIEKMAKIPFDITKDKFNALFDSIKDRLTNLKKHVKKNTISGIIEQNNALRDVEEIIRETPMIDDRQGTKSIDKPENFPKNKTIGK